MRSLRVGYASTFTLTNQFGTARGRPGTGIISVSAHGVLEDGTSLFFQTADGAPYKAPIVTTRIEFK
jgi:hypothetical protein